MIGSNSLPVQPFVPSAATARHAQHARASLGATALFVDGPANRSRRGFSIEITTLEVVCSRYPADQCRGPRRCLARATDRKWRLQLCHQARSPANFHCRLPFDTQFSTHRRARSVGRAIGLALHRFCEKRVFCRRCCTAHTSLGSVAHLSVAQLLWAYMNTTSTPRRRSSPRAWT